MALTSMDYWRLADELSVIDAAILITGNDPSERESKGDGFDSPFHEEQRTSYDGFEAVFKAIKNAILSNRIAAVAVYPVDEGDTSTYNPVKRPLSVALRKGTKLFQGKSLNFYGHDALVFLQVDPDWSKTTIEVAHLVNWLRSRGVYPDFFFPRGDPESFLNRENERYSAKLACAVAAWKAVTAPARNKSPKQSLEDWVTAHGVQFGLGNDEGIVPQNAKDEIAKVANWQPKGGAAKTGGEVALTTSQAGIVEVQNFAGFDIIASTDGFTTEVMPF